MFPSIDKPRRRPGWGRHGGLFQGVLLAVGILAASGVSANVELVEQSVVTNEGLHFW